MTEMCDVCGKTRTEYGPESDYNPTQLIFGQPVGWYNGDDGTICGACMGDIFRKANRL